MIFVPKRLYNVESQEQTTFNRHTSLMKVT